MSIESKGGPAAIPLPSPGALQALNKLCRRFLLASLVYMMLGMGLGVVDVLHLASVPTFVHMHLELIGFVAILIWGVGYKLIPTMFGGVHGVYSQRMADWHFWVANVALILMVVGYWLGVETDPRWFLALQIGGSLQFIGAGMFAYNMWMGLK
jgi:cbb3-type cytochrome oxidase subunit 1